MLEGPFYWVRPSTPHTAQRQKCTGHLLVSVVVATAKQGKTRSPGYEVGMHNSTTPHQTRQTNNIENNKQPAKLKGFC